jgi:hypothetical protein
MEPETWEGVARAQGLHEDIINYIKHTSAYLRNHLDNCSIECSTSLAYVRSQSRSIGFSPILVEVIRKPAKPDYLQITREVVTK